MPLLQWGAWTAGGVAWGLKFWKVCSVPKLPNGRAVFTRPMVTSLLLSPPPGCCLPTCLLPAAQGWWMYEVCPWRHITQYHPSDASMTDWVISLGHYQGVEWAPTNASQTSLYSKVGWGLGHLGWGLEEDQTRSGPALALSSPPSPSPPSPCIGHWPATTTWQGTKVPYVEQRYALGNICELDGVDAQGKRLEPVLRRTALRLMCSPSGEAHVVVSELQQCVYRVELYVPSLCTVPGFEVTPAPGGGADGDWDDDEDEEGDEDEVREPLLFCSVAAVLGSADVCTCNGELMRHRLACACAGRLC